MAFELAPCTHRSGQRGAITRAVESRNKPLNRLTTAGEGWLKLMLASLQASLWSVIEGFRIGVRGIRISGKDSLPREAGVEFCCGWLRWNKIINHLAD